MPQTNPLHYHAAMYQRNYDTPLGAWLWAFVTRRDNVERMERAAECNRPAAEAISATLLAELADNGFGEADFTDRDHQMTGHMIRQVMEHHGYVIDQTEVPVDDVPPFSRAASYRRRDA